MRSVALLTLALALIGCEQATTTVGTSNEGQQGNARSDGSAPDDEDEQEPNGSNMTPPVDEPGDSGGAPICETLNLQIVPEKPEILIVLDRSGSMAGERWQKVTQAIDMLITSFPEYEFGLSMFPAVGEELDCKPGKLDVLPGDLTEEAIREALFAPGAVAIESVGYTPTASTLRVAEAYLTAQTDTVQDRFVLLVTDGQPNCNAIGPTKSSADVEATLAALEALKYRGIPTFVFGYLTLQLASEMDKMAVAGGTGQHYAVEDEATILEAFAALGDSLAPCTFELDADAQPEFVRVVIDGVDLSLDANGFALEGGRTIQLVGDACAMLRDGAEHALEVLVECEPVRVL